MKRLPKDDRERPAGALLAPSEATASAGRFFLGVALTDETRHALLRHLNAVEIPGHLDRSEDWHLTLRFLGETSPEALEALRVALVTADFEHPFDIVFGRLGAFPGPERARVLWLGVEDGRAALTALAARVEVAAREAGFPPETGPFAPHVTLSRLAPPADVRRLVDRVPSAQERMTVGAVVLFRSRPGGGPGRYEEVERYALRHDPGALQASKYNPYRG